MITRGQMALDTNQHGYDVVSALNERISVKTVTTSTHVTFNQNTFHLVDRVMVLRVNASDDEGISVEEILDAPAEEAMRLMRSDASKFIYPISNNRRSTRPIEDLKILARARYKDLELRRYESGAIRAFRDDVEQNVVVKQILRSIAAELGVELVNLRGGLKNTQQLGADVIRAISAASYA